MSGLKTRLQYRGGKQKDRMTKDKLNSLRRAILYSYQAETAVLPDTREFGCLINPNRLTMEADDKMLSIPFEDIPFSKKRPDGETTSQGMEKIELAVGDVIGWKETDTFWLLYQRYLQEDAYYRFGMRQCNGEVDIDGKNYRVYLKGPDEKTIDWQKTKHAMINVPNYSLEMYISKNKETEEFFHRFTKITVKDKPWEVQGVDSITIDGLLLVYLKEDFTNNYEMREEPPIEIVDPEGPHIIGDEKVYPYDIKEYKIVNASGGTWQLSNSRARIIKQDDLSVTIEITTGKSGDISLIYQKENPIILNIKILSL